MRIAYVSLHWPRAAASSIGMKTNRHIQNWRQAGHEVEFFSHMHRVDPSVELVGGRYFVYGQESGFFGRLRSEMARINAATQLIAAIKLFQPDLIFLRWSMYVFPIQRLMNVAPVIVEINTNDVAEHRLLGLAENLYNRLTRGLLLNGASGHVYATQELMDLEVFGRFHKPGIVLSNSLDMASTPFYDAPANQPPHLLFIGTPGMPWHGEEKLIALAESFPDLIIDIVGIEKINSHDQAPPNLHLHGFLSGANYERMLAGADAAIGTLALHRKGMREAAPFKIRDCVARGIPCILPYIDTDFSGLDSRYFLSIPNLEDNVQTHGQAIRDFVYAMRGQRIPRKLVSDLMESSIKERERLQFFEKFVRRDKR